VGCAGRPPARLALNLGPHPYQGSTPGPVSPGLHLPPGRSMYGWRPLETARNRSAPMAGGPNVDQVRSPAGAAALRIADLGWQGRPPPTAPTSEPRPGDRLVRGSPGGVWARDIPLYRRAVSGHRHGGTPARCVFKPFGRWGVLGGDVTTRPTSHGVLQLLRGSWGRWDSNGSDAASPCEWERWMACELRF
jgi:hypothetical protein